MEIVITTKEDLKHLIKEILEDHQKTFAPKNTPNEELLDKKQAAELLQVSVATIDNYRRNGLLPCHQIGQTVRFKRQEVLNAISGK